MDQPISISEKKKERLLALTAERRRILAMTPEQALEAVAEHPYPVTLVQSFSEEDLYFLVHAIGPDDALPILGLASNEQWEYVLDMESWSADRPDNRVITQWLERLLKADADRFTHWIIHEKKDWLAYYLSRNIELHIREYEQDPAEVGEEFFTEDDTHYVRLRKIESDDPKDAAFETERDTFVLDLLKRMSVYDYMIYQGMLIESSAVLTAEVEEELLRLRSVRLGEKGFLPFDEAIGVYQPLSVSDLSRRARKTKVFSGRLVESYPLPVESQQPSQKTDRFSQTLARIQDHATLERLQAEFAGLCNQVIAADQKQVREKSDLAPVVAKVSGYISLGLEKAAADTVQEDLYADANLIQRCFLGDIFRVGYGCGLGLKWKAEQWHRNSWFAKTGLPLGFWGEVGLGVVGGLLLKKPLYFDNYASGVLYREFATLADIRHTDQTLQEIIAFDDLLSRMSLKLSPRSGHGFFTCSNLILTLWANHYLRLSGSPQEPHPLTFNQFRSFFQELWQTPTPPRKISHTMQALFMDWLANRTGLSVDEIATRIGSGLEHLFTLVENELGRVTLEDLDPRYIQLFCFEPS